MAINEFWCGRSDGKCPAVPIALDITESKNAYLEIKEVIRKLRCNPNTTSLDINELQKELNVEYTIYIGGEERIHRLKESKDPNIKLCDVCPYRKTLKA